ncbi:unnamed protein product [Toxocara canis]|uniref:G protein-coupled receptor n=1 Tax=Toxocara canis TaxID=6265 RepID=A0A183UVT9_TOXCA|nr:unnamed protein product [Toxocara canis]
MPFMRIDFSSYDASDAMQKTLREQPKGRTRIVVERCHTVLLFVLFIVILSVILLQVTLHVQLSVRNLRASSSLVLTMFQAQGFVNLIFLLFWDRRNTAESLRQSLMSTSTGVGVLRRRATLNNIHVAAMLYGCALSLLLVCYSVVQLFTAHFPYPPVQPSSAHPYLKWACLGVLVYLSITFPAAYAEVASLTSIITAEYRALNDDFADDTNTYQLPVAKHYVSAHWKLGNTFNLFKKSLSLWFSSHLMTSFMSSIFIWISLPPLRSFVKAFDSADFERVFESAFALLLFSLSIMQICILLAACVMVRFHLIRMRHPMIALIAGDRALHEQTYPLAIAYINHLHRRHMGITFFGIAIIDRKFIVEKRGSALQQDIKPIFVIEQTFVDISSILWDV